LANIGSVQYPLLIKSGGKEVILSGVFHTFEQNNVEINFLSLTYFIEFIDSGEKSDFAWSRIDSQTAKMILTNYNSPTGTAINPIWVAINENKKVYLTLTVYSVAKNSPKTIIYTFFSGENVNG